MYCRLELHSQNRLAGSSYSEPIFQTVNIPAPTNEYDFVKLYVPTAIVGADISGGDPGHININIKNKAPMNQVECRGTGSTVSYHITVVPYQIKETGQNYLYYHSAGQRCGDYLLYPISEFQDNNIHLEITDGNHNLIEAPNSPFDNYTIILGLDLCKREDVYN